MPQPRNPTSAPLAHLLPLGPIPAQLLVGAIELERLGTGSRISSTVLFGDNQWRGVYTSAQIDALILTLPSPPSNTVVIAGEDGEDGYVGPPGAQGAAGVAGSAGAQGPPGSTILLEGERGEDGWIGPPGVAGPSGASGAAGPTGATGPAGVTLFLEPDVQPEDYNPPPSLSGYSRLDTVQAWVAAQTFKDGNLLLQNPAATFSATIKAGAQTAARTFTFPATASTTIAVIGNVAQTFAGACTFSSAAVFNNTCSFGNTITILGGITISSSITISMATLTMQMADNVEQLIVQAAASQAVDLVQFQNSGASAMSSISATGDFVTSLAGVGIKIKEGSNARMNVATLVAGTVTISNTSVTASTRIFAFHQTLAGIGSVVALGCTARVAGASFTISSANVLDTSTIAWILFEPS